MNFRKQLQDLSKNCVNTKVEEIKKELIEEAKNGNYSVAKFISISDTIGLKAIEDLKKLGLTVEEIKLDNNEKLIFGNKKRKFIISWEEDNEMCEDKEELSEDDIAELADTDIYGHDWC